MFALFFSTLVAGFSLTKRAEVWMCFVSDPITSRGLYVSKRCLRAFLQRRLTSGEVLQFALQCKGC